MAASLLLSTLYLLSVYIMHYLYDPVHPSPGGRGDCLGVAKPHNAAAQAEVNVILPGYRHVSAAAEGLYFHNSGRLYFVKSIG